MYKFLLTIAWALSITTCFSQQLLTRQQAYTLAGANRVNTDAAQLDLLRQQQLLKGSRGFDNPELEFEIDPYDPMVLGVLMPLRLPGVYASRSGLQKERIRLSELMLQLNQYEINRLVQNTYNEVQYLYARVNLLQQQDSLYQSIKTAAKRNFEAGQINKLEELFASNEANNLHNELERTLIELPAQKRALSYILNYRTDFIVDSFRAMTTDPMLLSILDTISNSIRPQILQQQVVVSQKELKAERAELLPQINTGPLFGLQQPHGEGTKRQGWRVSLSMPIWRSQNRARIQAAQTGVQLAEAQRRREIQDLNREYTVAMSQLLREQKSLQYYATVANQQAVDITQTALRLFEAGQVNYIETMRNIITAFQTRVNYLETIRNFNQALTELKYLNGSL
ncbi:TolC family protein [Segetibacter sp.]|jgi:outer membrane protein TolC|uniref:TolC family protein n=1 Tax=Segetibacter sp. TaxID=2231182 RepID=UPI002606B661|nr:TolC family protein [Segetibacter sp.]MCW3079439.1 TolC family protein [Segetibacter sp.]